MCRTPERDYYGGLNEQLAAYELLGTLGSSPDLLTKKAVIAGSIGELYELFDDYDSASRYFSEGESMLESLSSSGSRFAETLGQLLDAQSGDGGEMTLIPAEQMPDDEIIADSVELDDCIGSESLCDDGGETDEYEEYVDGEDEIWEDASDGTPQG